MRVSVQIERTHEPLQRTPTGAWQTAEGQVVRIEVEGTEIAAASLGGETLGSEVRRLDPQSFRTTFTLPIHTWAGIASVYLTAGTEQRTLILDVAPHPGKLGSKAFRELVKELSGIDQNLVWGFAPGSEAAKRTSGSPPIVHPLLVEAELPGLLKNLRRLRAQPLTRTLRVRETVPVLRARRADRATLTWLSSRPRVLAALRPDDEFERPPDPGVRVDQARITTTLDHPATRYIRYLLERLIRHLSSSRDALGAVGKGKEEGFRDPVAQARARELAASLGPSIQDLRGILRRPPFRDVRAEGPTSAAMQALLDHPLYLKIQRAARRLLDPGVTLDSAGCLRAGLRATWDLYELSVLFRLGDQLSLALEPLGWTTRKSHEVGGHVLAGVEGNPIWTASLGEVSVELRYQQPFSGFQTGQSTAGFRSRSKKRIPDYVLGRRVRGKLESWLVLDAKFRSSRAAIHEGLADVHVYRDSLMWDGLKACMGYVLAPALQEDATRYSELAYLQEHCFGVLRTDQRNWAEVAGKWVESGEAIAWPRATWSP